MVVYDASNEWVRQQRAAWLTLAGSTVVRWVGMDESVGGDDAITFLEQDAPFRYLARLRIELQGTHALDLATYQNDQSFGLSLQLSDEIPLGQSRWWREADLGYLPAGQVAEVDLHLDARDGSESDVIEAELTILGRKTVIVAADFDTWEDHVFNWGDEMLLVFADPPAAEQVVWTTPRQFVIASPVN